MVYKIVWTDPAIENLRDLCQYVSGENPESAQRLALEIMEQAEQLEHFPGTGKVYRNFGNGRIRELAFRGYRMFYVISEERKQVDILQIWHGHRDEPPFEVI